MGTKARLVYAITAFCLVLTLLITGVWAAKTATIHLGGSISFKATNVFCQVTGEYSGTENAVTNPTKLSWDAENEPSDSALASWSGDNVGLLEFDEKGSPIIFTVTIQNKSTELDMIVKLALGDTDTCNGFGRTFQFLDQTGATNTYTLGSEMPLGYGKTCKFIITYNISDPDTSIAEQIYDYDFTLTSNPTEN